MMVHAALGLMLLVADIGPQSHGSPPGYIPAPVPDPSFDLPRPREQKQVEVEPALTNTRAYVPIGNGYASGSAFHSQLTRRTQPLSQIGSELAPGLTVRIPLK